MPLAVTFPLSGRFGDLHPLEYVRAGRTKEAALFGPLLLFYPSRRICQSFEKAKLTLGKIINLAHLQSSVFKLSKDLIDSIHEEGIVAYTS